LVVLIVFKKIESYSISGMEMPPYAIADNIFLTNLQKGKIAETILPLDNIKIQVS